MRLFAAVALFALLLGAPGAVASASSEVAQTHSGEQSPRANADPLAAQRRMTAAALLTSLADKARDFRDMTLRTRAQARAADALWELDPELARTLFRRAWADADAADREIARKREEDRKAQLASGGVAMQSAPPQLRAEVLHVTDDGEIAESVRSVLEAEGWRVETCTDAKAALRKLIGEARFDVVLLDGDLPGVSAPELVRRAKAIPGRRSTPIVVLSARDCEAESWRAGVAAYLRKPEGLHQVPQIMARLREDEAE